MTTITLDNKKIANILLQSFGGGLPLVQQYDDDLNAYHVDILSIESKTDSGISYYGTIGLSDYDMPFAGGSKSIRIELCAGGLTSNKYFPKVIASAAFAVMKSKISLRPGCFIENQLKLYDEKIKLPHLYFTSPFYWEEDLKEIKLKNKKINWLQCFPISENELNYLKENGDDLFEDALENADSRVFDFQRKSIF